MARSLVALLVTLAIPAFAQNNIPETPKPKTVIIAHSFNVMSTFAWAASLKKASSDCVAEVLPYHDRASIAAYHPRQEFIHAVEIGLAVDSTVFLISHYKPRIGKYLPWISASAKFGMAATTFIDGCASQSSIL